MLQLMGSERLRHDLATTRQQLCAVELLHEVSVYFENMTLQLWVLFVHKQFCLCSLMFSSVTQLCLTICDLMIITCQASLSITNSWSSLRLTSIKSVMPSSHLILCRPLLLLPPIPPSIRVFSNESTLHMRWPKYWSFSFSIIPSNEHPGLISFRMDWLDLLVLQGTLKSLLQHHTSKASILRPFAFHQPSLGLWFDLSHLNHSRKAAFRSPAKRGKVSCIFAWGRRMTPQMMPIIGRSQNFAMVKSGGHQSNSVTKFCITSHGALDIMYLLIWCNLKYKSSSVKYCCHNA